MADKEDDLNFEKCPDGGYCHHGCKPMDCFRVHCCGPLSGVFPENQWPIGLRMAHGVVTERLTR